LLPAIPRLPLVFLLIRGAQSFAHSGFRDILKNQAAQAAPGAVILQISVDEAGMSEAVFEIAPNSGGTTQAGISLIIRQNRNCRDKARQMPRLAGPRASAT
jgi:hypothetical protein